MNKIIFIDKASEELHAAVKYYNKERPGLGFEFANEVKSTLSRIRLHPEVWAEIDEGIRKCIVKRFPYALLYLFDNSKIVIIAVMHMKKKPGYWKTRIPN